MPGHIHIFGASGSGTTSLASALAATHGHRHLDTDDFYWFPTDPPYRKVRPRELRLALLRDALAESSSWVLSGSLCGWGDPLIPQFDLVVFLVVPTEVRLARLRAREIERYGHEAIAPGGALHQAHAEFLDWAGRYDAGGLEMRSRALHEAWLSTLPGAALRLEGERSIDDQLAQIEASLGRDLALPFIPVPTEIISVPIPLEQIRRMAAEQFGDFVKAVVDVRQGLMAVGGELHADEEAALLQHGARQADLWGINLYPDRSAAEFIEFDSMINLRPSQGNRSRSVEDASARRQIEDVVARLIAR